MKNIVNYQLSIVNYSRKTLLLLILLTISTSTFAQRLNYRVYFEFTVLNPNFYTDRDYMVEYTLKIFDKDETNLLEKYDQHRAFHYVLDETHAFNTPPVSMTLNKAQSFGYDIVDGWPCPESDAGIIYNVERNYDFFWGSDIMISHLFCYPADAALEKAIADETGLSNGTTRIKLVNFPETITCANIEYLILGNGIDPNDEDLESKWQLLNDMETEISIGASGKPEFVVTIPDDEYSESIGKTIYIRLILVSDGAAFEENGIRKYYITTLPLQYEIKPQMPQAGATPINALCNGENGAIRIAFDRDLNDDEQLQLFWNNLNGIILKKDSLTHEGDKWYYVYKNLSPGNHNLTVAGWNGTQQITGLTQTIPVTINQPALLSYTTLSKEDIKCYGSNIGKIIIQASGGTAPYTLHWNKSEEPEQTQTSGTGENTFTLTGLSGGTYTYYITDINGCEYKNASGRIINTVTINAPSSALAISDIEVTEPTGNGLDDGYITFNVSGGYGNYLVSYKYNNGTSQTLDYAPYMIIGAAGTYEITVADNTVPECTVSKTVTIAQPAALQCSIIETKPVSCFNGDDGALSASASGGTLAPIDNYRFEWYKKTGNTFDPMFQYTNVISDLESGTYKLIVKDSNGNTAEKEHTLAPPVSVKATEIISQNILCYGENTGSIQFKVSGGSGIYTVYYMRADIDDNYRTTTVSGSGSLFKLNNLSPGVYQFYIKDSKGCDASPVSDIELTQPDAALRIAQSTIFASGIGKNDGRITILFKGGISPYTVELKNNSGTGFSGTNTISGEYWKTELLNLTAGRYTLNIKDANGCSISQIFDIEERSALQVNLNTENIKCYGASTGEIIAHATGGLKKEGSMPYNYTWYTIKNSVETLLANETDSILSNIPAGRYKAIITDFLDDAVTSTIVEITQPTELIAAITKQNIICFGGNTGYIHITATGGTGIYTLYYKLTGETAYNSIQSLPGNTALNIDNLSVGIYNLYLEDSNGCIASFSGENNTNVELTQPEKALGIVSEEIIHLSGYKTQNGKITTIIEGGTPPYTFVWKDSLNNPVASIVGTNEVTTSVSGLQAGNYTLTITDANYISTTGGCFFTKNYTLTQPDMLTMALTPVNILCNGFSTGSITVKAQGGVPATTGLPYIYQWYTVNDTGQETLIAETTGSILENIPAGKYKIKITDYSYLPNTTESDVIIITQPQPLVTSVSLRDISCFNGDDGYIHIQTSGGAGGYKLFYKLQEENNYNILSVNETDNTFYLDERIAGTYNIYILDSNDCYAPINGSDITLIRLEQPQKALQIVDKDSIDPSGYNRRDGQITITVEGGRAPYSVVWKDDKGNTFPGTDKVENDIFTNTLSGLPEGTYNVEIRDSGYTGAAPHTTATCMANDIFYLVQPDSLMVTITETRSIPCYGESTGQLSVSATGGVPKAQGIPYSYQWFSHDGSNFIELPGENSTVLDNRPTGLYRVKVTDFSRIPNITVTDFQLGQPELLTATATQKEINCGETTPVNVIVAGGTQPYSFDWATGHITQEIGNTPPGNYLVLVTDANGCQTTTWAHITTPGNIRVESETTDPDCYHGSNGSIKLNVSGGKPPYTYLWNYGNQTSKDLSGLPAGNYTVTVRDDGGCTFNSSFILSDPQQLTVDIGKDRTLCNGQSLTLTPTVNQPDVQYAWTGPDAYKSTASNIFVEKAGTYRLTVTNDKGCQASGEIHIDVSDTNISSEFVVANHVFINDTIMIVNISQVEPEWQEWLFPETDSLKVMETHDHYAKVIFYELGNYTFGLRSHIGSCFQEIWKTVTVVEQNYKDSELSGESIINEFTVTPNPNKGTFTIKVELSKECSIHLRLFSIKDGKIWNAKRLDGESSYEEPYEMLLPPGIYVMLLETASGRTTLKMIVN